MKTNKIILLSGVSASGKSTYAKKLKAELDGVIVCADDIRAELGDVADQSKNGHIFNEVMPFRIEGWTKVGFDVIIDITSPDRKTRKQFIDLAKRLKCEIESHYVLPDVKRSKIWNKRRDRRVPEFVIDKQAAKWVTPTLDEGFSKVVKIEQKE